MSMEMVKWGWWQGGAARSWSVEYNALYNSNPTLPNDIPAPEGWLAYGDYDVASIVAHTGADNGYALKLTGDISDEKYPFYQQQVTGYTWFDNVDNSKGWAVQFRFLMNGAGSGDATYNKIVHEFCDGTYFLRMVFSATSSGTTKWIIGSDSSGTTVAMGGITCNAGNGTFSTIGLKAKGTDLEIWQDGVKEGDWTLNVANTASNIRFGTNGTNEYGQITEDVWYDYWYYNINSNLLPPV